MNANQLRSKFLEFFKSKGHAVIKSAPLIPDNDPTVLFTTAGMHPLVPFLLGAPHPLGKRLCDVQKCIRTGDIDEVSRTLAAGLADNAAVVYGQVLSNEEMENIINALFVCSNFNYTPDGKKILCILKETEIEHLFS